MLREKPIAPLRQAMPSGVELLHDPVLNKGTAFNQAERAALGLRGLLPPAIHSQATQVQRVLENFRRKPNDLEKYIFLMSLQDRNLKLFYRVVIDNLEEMMPILYTPTVGQACQQYAHIFRRPRGLYISAADQGSIHELLRNWPYDDVRVIVVTDGERILGLGDLGANGMGIPVGKLALYTACAGIDPLTTLPITLDVGTENHDLLRDPLYIGLRQRRWRGRAYDELLDEFVRAVHERFPQAVIQFEDFATDNAFRLLQRYRGQVCTFNDDIQGTASVTLAGLYSAMRLTGGRLRDQRLLFLGAGEAGIGIADLTVAALCEEGLTEAEARRRCWFVDSQGLVVSGRHGLAAHKLPYAHEHEPAADLLTAVRTLRPTALIGVSGRPRLFTQPVIEAMSELNERPLIFALSNPTANSECTAEEAYTWSDGRAIFASGSPFAPVTISGRTIVPGQGNNAYIFPGLGLGLVTVGAAQVTDAMFLAAAKALAGAVSTADLNSGSIYPPIRRIRDVSAVLATAVAETAYQQGLASHHRPANLAEAVRAHMVTPDYVTYIEDYSQN